MLAGRLFFFFFLGGGGGGAPPGRAIGEGGEVAHGNPDAGEGVGKVVLGGTRVPPVRDGASQHQRARKQTAAARQAARDGGADRRATSARGLGPISSVSSRRELAGTYQKFDVLPIHYPRESCAPESKAESAALGYCQYPEIGSEWKTNLDFEKMSKIMGS
ncbi:hypothetical protein DFH07DRAFT_768908 [Mycena maculata]|uniref:Uncharacterized protein n=1 Tax=Mycena maculata TaxID=230809 RepID=A0AAD7NQ26_9AGAR|nr:hypothetical protein DFH07DRAFT_768908 [Mycena maculata]